MSLLSALTEVAVRVVESLGYAGIFLFMFLEGAITPIPSEVVLPFAGFLAAEGRMSVPVIVLVASLASMLGSGVAYQMGLRLGRPFVLRYGRYLLLDAADLVRAEGWFRRWGIAGVFAANCLPGSRSIVAYPAGAGRMAFVPFLVATFGGAVIWNSVLTLAGFYLFTEWRRIVDTFELIDLVALAVIVGGVGVYVYRQKRQKATAD